MWWVHFLCRHTHPWTTVRKIWGGLIWILYDGMLLNERILLFFNHSFVCFRLAIWDLILFTCGFASANGMVEKKGGLSLWCVRVWREKWISSFASCQVNPFVHLFSFFPQFSRVWSLRDFGCTCIGTLVGLYRSSRINRSHSKLSRHNVTRILCFPHVVNY